MTLENVITIFGITKHSNFSFAKHKNNRFKRVAHDNVNLD